MTDNLNSSVDYSLYFQEITGKLSLLDELNSNQTELIEREKITSQTLTELTTHVENIENTLVVSLGLFSVMVVILLLIIVSQFLSNMKE